MGLSCISQTYSCVDEMHQSDPHTSQPTNRSGWSGLLLRIVAAAVVGLAIVAPRSTFVGLADRRPRRDLHPRRRHQRRDPRSQPVLAKNGNDKHAHVMAGPQAQWAKVAFEQVFIGSRKRGVLALKTRFARETHEQH